VEVTKLSLLLKVLEGETRESIHQQRRLFHGERVLPDLASNIKCGNSLIGSDFYDVPTQGDLFEDEERVRINVFDWNEGFPAIMKSGGFDAVIGNPPYIRIQRIAHTETDYLFGKFECPTSKIDLSLVFLEQALRLANPLGRVGFICTLYLTMATTVAKLYVCGPGIGYCGLFRAMIPRASISAAQRPKKPMTSYPCGGCNVNGLPPPLPKECSRFLFV
jgi:Eco57I restriction-modification methylase